MNARSITVSTRASQAQHDRTYDDSPEVVEVWPWEAGTLHIIGQRHRARRRRTSWGTIEYQLNMGGSWHDVTNSATQETWNTHG